MTHSDQVMPSKLASPETENIHKKLEKILFSKVKDDINKVFFLITFDPYGRGTSQEEVEERKWQLPVLQTEKCTSQDSVSAQEGKAQLVSWLL